MKDLRQAYRRRALTLVEIYFQDGECRAGLVYDVGHNGMFIVTEANPIVNGGVEIIVDTVENIPARISGFVIHRRNYGFGLLFQQLNNAAHNFLEQQLS